MRRFCLGSSIREKVKYSLSRKTHLVLGERGLLLSCPLSTIIFFCFLGNKPCFFSRGVTLFSPRAVEKYKKKKIQGCINDKRLKIKDELLHTNHSTACDDQHHQDDQDDQARHIKIYIILSRENHSS